MTIGLAHVERRALTPTPTPLQPLVRFGAAIGREVWIKRDDIGSIGYAGNKIRKLEYLAPRIEASGVDTLLIVGARQSNAARATAAYAAATGRRCVIVVPSEPPDPPPPAEANALLSGLFGAEFHHLGAVGWAEAEAACTELAEAFEREGATCDVLPAGCSSPHGTLGFVAAHRELLRQLEDTGTERAAAVVHASSSCGTAAGLALGRALHGGPPILSVDVGRLFEPVEERILGLADGASALDRRPRTGDRGRPRRDLRLRRRGLRAADARVPRGDPAARGDGGDRLRPGLLGEGARGGGGRARRRAGRVLAHRGSAVRVHGRARRGADAVAS